MRFLHSAFLLNSHATGRAQSAAYVSGPPKTEMARLSVGPLPREQASGIATFVALRVIFPLQGTKTPVGFGPLQPRRSCGKWSWKPRRYQPENFPQPDSPGSRSLLRMARGCRHRRFLCCPTTHAQSFGPGRDNERDFILKPLLFAQHGNDLLFQSLGKRSGAIGFQMHGHAMCIHGAHWL